MKTIRPTHPAHQVEPKKDPGCDGTRFSTLVLSACARFACFVSVVVLCAGISFAQAAPRPVTRKPTVRGKLEPNMIRLNKRAPIPFKPFDMLDTKTQKPVSPTATVTLPNGKTATAKEYYDQLNSFEKWLNENGYSMRTAAPNARTTIAELVVDQARLDRQRELAPKPKAVPRRTDLYTTYSQHNLSTLRPIQIAPSDFVAAGLRPPANPRSLEEINVRFTAASVKGTTLDGLIISPSTLGWIAKEGLSNISGGGSGNQPPHHQPGPCASGEGCPEPGGPRGGPGPQPTGTPQPHPPQPPQPQPQQPQCTLINPPAQSWNWNYGDPGSFYAYTEATLGLGGLACIPPDMQNFTQNNPSSFLVTAEAKGGGSVFGAGGDLIRAIGNMGGNQSNNTVTGNLDIYVIGQNILDIHKTENAGWSAQDNLSYPVDFSVEVPIPLGPISIDATLGAQGSVGLQYSASLAPISASFTATPSVHTAAYAEIGVGVYIGSVGVYGSLNPILDWNMNLHADAGMGWLFGLYAYEDFYADTDVHMLAGTFGVYLKVGVDPFSHEWDFQLFSEPGLQLSGVLVDAKNKIPLNP